MTQAIQACRVCGNARLELVLDLGVQVLTGVFPIERDQCVTTGPLRLVKCVGDNACGLLQLEHSYDLSEMYGEYYGYRSGLNPTMVSHLQGKVRRVLESVAPTAGDIIVDIGSNDSTTLQAFPQNGAILVGIDPTGTKFRRFYPPHIELIPDFFSAGVFKRRFGGQKAKVVTSFSMFYDLEDPLDFMRQIHEVLADDGIWVFEQSYMPTMLQMNSYDTVCHEHLEYYAVAQIKWMADRAGFTLIDLEFNDVNGGSVSLTARRSADGIATAPAVQEALERERQLGLDTLAPFEEFATRVATARDELVSFVRRVRGEGKTVVALGASTKGNVILQYCGLTSDDIAAVGEVNADKFGCYTPGSRIPIVPEDELVARAPDYAIILPWHFKRFFTSNPKFAGLKLVVPLPRLEVLTPEREQT